MFAWQSAQVAMVEVAVDAEAFCSSVFIGGEACLLVAPLWRGKAEKGVTSTIGRVESRVLLRKNAKYKNVPV